MMSMAIAQFSCPGIWAHTVATVLRYRDSDRRRQVTATVTVIMMVIPARAQSESVPGWRRRRLSTRTTVTAVS